MHRFTCGQDIFLMRAVIALNPFEDSKRWEVVAKNLSALMPVSKRCCRERTNILIKTFMKDDSKNLRQRGSEEEVAEKISLLQVVVDLQKETESLKKRAAELQLSDCLWDSYTVDEICNAAITGRGRPHSNTSGEDTTPPLKRPRHSLLVDFVADKRSKDYSLRESLLKLRYEELVVEKRRIASEEAGIEMKRLYNEKRLALEEKRLEMETKRMELDKEERKSDREMFLQVLKLALQK